MNVLGTKILSCVEVLLLVASTTPRKTTPLSSEYKELEKDLRNQNQYIK